MQILIDTDLLPSFASMNTAHWPSDQQLQFSKAIDGIKSAEWFRQLHDGTKFEKERLANAIAFAAFSHLRKRMNLASDADLMRDNAGTRSPAPLSTVTDSH